MIRAIRPNDAGVRRALRAHGVADRTLLGRGVFSLVYDGGRRRVLKLTLDAVSYSFMREAKNKHFPRIRHDYGVVGSTVIDMNEFPLFLMEVERLQKLPNGSEAKKIATAVHRADRYQWIQTTLLRLKGVKTVPNSIRNAIKELETFVGNDRADLVDMHMANFMCRRNGELVISDPLMDRFVWETRIMEEGRLYGNKTGRVVRPSNYPVFALPHESLKTLGT